MIADAIKKPPCGGMMGNVVFKAESDMCRLGAIYTETSEGERMAGDKSKFLYCADVMELLQCKATKARTVIRTLNDELKKRGYLTTRGKVSRKFFMEKYYG